MFAYLTYEHHVCEFSAFSFEGRNFTFSLCEILCSCNGEHIDCSLLGCDAVWPYGFQRNVLMLS